MDIKKQVLQKAEELGEGAPKWFAYSAKTIESWKKKPNSIPLKAVEKVLIESNKIKPDENPPSVQAPNAPTQRQSSVAVVPPRNPDPMMPPPEQTPAAQNQATIQPAPPYTIDNAQADIVAIVKHFNERVSPTITGIKNQGEVNANAITGIHEQLRSLMEWKARVDRLVPSQQEQAPTVGQLLAAHQPSDQFNQLSNPNDLPSRLNPAAKAQVIAEYNPPQQNGNNLDTGIAPSAADRARSLGALADRQDPRNPGRPAGPATPPPQDAPGLTGWTNRWPAKK